MRSFIDYVYYLAKSPSIWENKEITDEFGVPVIHKMSINVSEHTKVSVCKYYYIRHFRHVSRPFKRHTEFFTLSGKTNANIAFGKLPVDDDVTLSLVAGSWLRIASNETWLQLNPIEDTIVMEVEMKDFYNSLPEADHEYDNITTMSDYQQETLFKDFRVLIMSKFAMDVDEVRPNCIGAINRFVENDRARFLNRNRKF